MPLTLQCKEEGLWPNRQFLLDKTREIGYVLMGEHTQSVDSF